MIMVVEKFRAFTELFRYGERPLSYEKWEKLVLKYTERGIPLYRAPSTFTLTETFMKTFDEMLPVKNGKLDTSIQSEAVSKAEKRLEVGRGISSGPYGKHLLVEAKDSGYSEAKPEGSYLYRDPIPYEIGSIHTHPPDLNPMPSSMDVTRMVQGESLSIVVTPRKVVTLLRSSKTPFLPKRVDAENFMSQMAERKKKHILIFSPTTHKEKELEDLEDTKLWVTNYSDLSELDILSYEAKRGKPIFTRAYNYTR